MEQVELRQIIETEFVARKSKNPGYSLRAYSKFLGVDAGSLSRFLKGERDFSFNKLKSLAYKIGLSEQQLEKAFVDVKFGLIEAKHFSLLANWYYVAILECIALDDFQPNPHWIARQLNVSLPIINVAVNQLMRAGAIEITVKGEWVNNFKNFTTQSNENIDDLALRNHQKQLLSLAQQSIDFNAADKKSHTAFVTALDADLVPELKQEIKIFREKIANLIKKKSIKRDSLYCLQINFFEEKEKENEGGSCE